MSTCAYCLNLPRLPIPPGTLPSDARYFDCPVCQENRIQNEFGETNLQVEEPEIDEDDEIIFDEDPDMELDDDEDYPDDEEEYDDY